jgi:CMP/dCMP kinase
MIIAIDGPAGAGKSSVAQAVAQALGFQLLDTGAIYRTVALVSDESGVDWDDGDALGELAATLEIRYALLDGRNHVYLRRGDTAERDVTPLLRTPRVSQGASRVANHPPVRAALLELQRRIGRAKSSVVEGRDIGTVVFPDASCKIFLTASPEVRARRRHAQLLSKGATDVPPVEAIAAEISERDTRDSQRAVAPLRAADDAVLVDSSDIPEDAVVGRILQIAAAAN